MDKSEESFTIKPKHIILLVCFFGLYVILLFTLPVWFVPYAVYKATKVMSKKARKTS